jgi:GntR family transcriptional regulator/MocR family aminotransferase
MGVPAIEQLALADFIGRGALDRQIRIMRKRYQHRARALTDALKSTNWLDVRPVHAGLHVTALINRDDVAENNVLDRAEAASVGISGLTRHHVGNESRPGLVFGFSRPAEHEFTQSLERLVAALRR